MRYQAILFDLDGTLLPMHEQTFVDRFYGVLVEYLNPSGVCAKEIGEVLQGSLQYVLSNDGSCSNKQAFVNYYEHHYLSGGTYISITDMERFYETVFDQQVRSSCGFDPTASQVVDYIKGKHVPIIVATNPFFPRVATNARLGWAGLNPADFHEITVYENSHYCKPNLMYYKELFERTGFDPGRCLMVGNNVNEDMIAAQLGCDVYLITRNLINPKQEDISKYKHGDLIALLDYLKSCL